VFFLRTPKRDLELKLPNPHFFTPNFPKNIPNSLFENILFLGFSDVGEVQTPDRKR